MFVSNLNCFICERHFVDFLCFCCFFCILSFNMNINGMVNDLSYTALV